MNTPNKSASIHNAAPVTDAEETLRLISSLPAPEGLEERMKMALRAAPRAGRVLHWPANSGAGRRWTHNTMARCAAAAAIVFVVAGGGWGVYSRVQPIQNPKVIAMPRVVAPGGFSNAGAMRTPQTLNGHVLSHPVTGTTKQTLAIAKAPARAAQKLQRVGKANQSGITAK